MHSTATMVDVNQLTDKLQQIDFNSPAKIFQNKHAVHQFHNITPDVSMPGTPLLSPHNKRSSQTLYDSDTHSLPTTAVHTPPSLSPHHSDDDNDKPREKKSNDNEKDNYYHSSNSTVSLPSRPATPSQFVFKRPQYNKEYHHTHFHHLEKKDTIFHDLKRFFKGDKKKKKLPSIASNSDLSFANEFNRDLEGKYGKWGKCSKIMIINM